MLSVPNHKKCLKGGSTLTFVNVNQNACETVIEVKLYYTKKNIFQSLYLPGTFESFFWLPRQKCIISDRVSHVMCHFFLSFFWGKVVEGLLSTRPTPSSLYGKALGLH